MVFPWGYGVVLANISRKAFEDTDLANVLSAERVICQDEMVETAEPEEFQRRLWGMFGVTFRCLLTLPQIDRVRWHLFPEIRVTQGTFDLAKPDEQAAGIVPDIVRVMDLQQEQLARSMGEGHRVIHGVAGSGKTMILGYRALHLAQALAKPILVLCYNAALAARLQSMMEERGLGQKVSARSFHGWCNDQLRLYHVPRPQGEGQAYFERLVEAVIRGVDQEQIPRAQYGAVLIDEGHDFDSEWLKLIAQMVDPETSSLLVLYDDAQSINRPKSRLRFSFAEVGIQARGRTTILKVNYRNTAEVMALACRFAREVLSPKEAEEDDIPLLLPESSGRRGEIPTLRRLANEQGELDFIVNRARALHKDGAAWKDMAVLFRVNRDGERIAAHLAKSGIPVNLFGGPERRQFRATEDSVKLMTFHSSKGLEFPVVFIPFLEALPYMKDDVAGEARLLYVAMTRAMERLILTHHGDSRFVGELSEAIAA
jgi:superfamily I DNA/RNA helicase